MTEPFCVPSPPSCATALCIRVFQGAPLMGIALWSCVLVRILSSAQRVFHHHQCCVGRKTEEPALLHNLPLMSALFSCCQRESRLLYTDRGAFLCQGILSEDHMYCGRRHHQVCKETALPQPDALGQVIKVCFLQKGGKEEKLMTMRRAHTADGIKLQERYVAGAGRERRAGRQEHKVHW